MPPKIRLSDMSPRDKERLCKKFIKDICNIDGKTSGVTTVLNQELTKLAHQKFHEHQFPERRDMISIPIVLDGMSVNVYRKFTPRGTTMQDIFARNIFHIIAVASLAKSDEKRIAIIQKGLRPMMDWILIIFKHSDSYKECREFKISVEDLSGIQNIFYNTINHFSLFHKDKILSIWAKSIVFLAMSNLKDPVALLQEELLKGISYVLAYTPQNELTNFLGQELDESIAWLESSVKNIHISLFRKAKDESKYQLGDTLLFAGLIIPVSWWAVIPWAIGTTYFRYGQHVSIKFKAEETQRILSLFFMCFSKKEISPAVKPAIVFLMDFTTHFSSKNRLEEFSGDSFYQDFMRNDQVHQKKLISELFFWYAYYIEYSSYQLQLDTTFDKSGTESQTTVKKAPQPRDTPQISVPTVEAFSVGPTASCAATVEPEKFILPEHLILSFLEQPEEEDVFSKWMTSFRRPEQVFQERHFPASKLIVVEQEQRSINVKEEDECIYLLVFTEKNSKAFFKIAKTVLNSINDEFEMGDEFKNRYMNAFYNKFIVAQGEFGGFKYLSPKTYELKHGQGLRIIYTNQGEHQVVPGENSIPVYEYSQHFWK